MVNGRAGKSIRGIAIALLVAGVVGCGGDGSGGGSDSGTLSVGQATSRDADGFSTRLGETVTVEGVATVSAGVLANNKLKIFIQDGPDGIMVYHQSAGDVEEFQAGQALRATGVIRQEDPTSDNNPAIGTIAVDITAGSATVLSEDEPIPAAQLVTLADLDQHGNDFVGSLVRVEGVELVSGEFPMLGDRSSQVTISDDGGTTTVILRFQRNTITQETVDELAAIGDAPFNVGGIVVQDDDPSDGQLLSGYEIWIRGAQDIG